MNRTIVLVLGLVLLGVGLGVSYTEWASGIQPWGQLLGDNFLFARSLPFTVGFGIAVGLWRASGWRWGTARRASDGAIRRFAPGTVVLHALAGMALLVLIATGGWQYLKGLLDALLSIYVGYLFVASAVRPKLTQKGLLLQAAPLLGGIALTLVALPLVWSCLRLVAMRTG